MREEISLYIYLNLACNLNCKYCYVKKNSKALVNIEAIKSKLSYFFNKNSFLFINFSGGEPLLSYSKLQQLVEYIKKQQKIKGFAYQFCLLTNGTLLTANKLNYLQKNNFKIILSLDGLKSSTDQNRRFKGNKLSVYDTVINKIKNNGVLPQLEISKVITPNNLVTLSEDILTLNKLGFTSVNLQVESYKKWTAAELERFHQAINRLVVTYTQLFDNSATRVIKINNLQRLISNESHRLLNCDQYRINYDGTVFLCLSYLFDQKLLHSNNLEQIPDFKKAKSKLINQQLALLIKKEHFQPQDLFCPLDLYVYCQEKKIEFKPLYLKYINLAFYLDSACKKCWQLLKNKAKFRQLYHLN